MVTLHCATFIGVMQSAVNILVSILKHVNKHDAKT